MCGRFALDEKSTDLEGFLQATNLFTDWSPTYSIAPTNVVPIVRERQHEGEITRSIEAAVWDFKPGWLKKENRRPQFNSRIETVTTNGLWKSAFAKSRCIVPMRGYYEWTEREGKKWPHFLCVESELLTAAGIYAARKDGDEWVLSCSIVTREARDKSGEIHDRMPAFLTPDAWGLWLAPVELEDDREKADMVKMLTAVSDDVAATIDSYEVDRKVNNSRTADPGDASLIEPVAS